MTQAEENARAFVTKLVERANQCENPRAVLQAFLTAAEMATPARKEETR